MPREISGLGAESAVEPGACRNRAALVSTDVPVVAAWHSARMVGINKEALSTERDHRVKIQFPWQRS